MKEDIEYRLDYGKQEPAGECRVVSGLPSSTDVGGQGRGSLFWRFPGVSGVVQPWRRRLWELQNNRGRE